MRRFFFLIITIFLAVELFSQDYFLTGHYIFLNEKNVYYKNINTTIKPSIGAENQTIDSLIFSYPKKEGKNIFVRKLFYEHLFQLQKNKFITFFDPVLDFRMNYDRQRNEIGYLNTRGFNIAGNLMSKIFFNTSFYENQGKFPAHIHKFYEQIKTIPGYARIKITSDSIFDFAQVFGTIAFKPLEQLNINIGYDRLFIGEGYRSMLLSDFAAPYPFLKINLKIGKLDYTTLITKALLPFDQPENSKYPSNILSYNILTYSILKDKLKFSLLDALSIDNGSHNYGFFAINYFVPYIRNVAFNNWKYSFSRQTGLNIMYQNSKIGIFYAQTVFNFSFLRINKNIEKNNGFSSQIGYKNFDFCGLQNLYFQFEYNFSNPNVYGSYFFNNFSQYLTSPINQHLNELITILAYSYKRFQILSKINFIYLPYNSIILHNYAPFITDKYNMLYYSYKQFLDYRTLLSADFQVVYTINPAYNLQIFAGTTLRKPNNNYLNYYLNFGLRTAIRYNSYDF